MQNKEEQKQHLIDMMRGDEELGLYNEQTERMYTEEDLRRAYNYGMFAVTSGRSFSDWFKERNKQ